MKIVFCDGVNFEIESDSDFRIFGHFGTKDDSDRVVVTKILIPQMFDSEDLIRIFNDLELTKAQNLDHLPTGE